MTFFSEERQINNGMFLAILIIGIVALITISTGSLMIFGYLWDVTNSLSKTIPLWLGFILLIMFIILIRPKE